MIAFTTSYKSTHSSTDDYTATGTRYYSDSYTSTCSIEVIPDPKLLKRIQDAIKSREVMLLLKEIYTYIIKHYTKPTSIIRRTLFSKSGFITKSAKIKFKHILCN